MALRYDHNKNIFGDNIAYKDAYVQITSLSGNKEVIQLNVVIYKNDRKDIVLDSKIYTFTPSLEGDSKNFIEQGYIFLKNNIEYKGSVDC